MHITQSEKVDMVNELDVVIGVCDKSEAHKKGYLHRTVVAEVKNSRGEWILVKQAEGRQDAGQYVSPIGGHVRSGEGVDEALKREAEEEMGIQHFTHTYLGKGIFDREVLGRRENHLFILYEIISDDEPVLNHESVSFRRFTVGQLKKELKCNPQIFGAAFHFVVARFFASELLGINTV